MSSRTTKRLVRGGDFVAEVEVRLVEDESGWSPYLSPEDAFKLDDVRDALRAGDVKRAAQLAARYKDDDLTISLAETSSHVVKVVDDLQQGIMEVRMLPIGTVFNGFPRMVRDLAQKFNKDVEFVIEGQETEIDRTVIERI
ncbi:MAG: hypothetical protein IH939_17105, partial [Acidobacteria bacterium]|nr:hypothetical protein [Acidobacteriota bacterium]